MPRATTPSTPTDSLPEFLRSKAIGAVIAEALDSAVNHSGHDGDAVTSMVSDASREIREFHGMHAVRPATRLTPPGSDPMGYGEDAGATT